ncbi:MAG: hypothetical protein QXR60_03795 [Candidatus Nanoarchaeia archaeon]
MAERFVIFKESELVKLFEVISSDPDYESFAKAVFIDQFKAVGLQRIGLSVSEQYRQLAGVGQGERLRQGVRNQPPVRHYEGVPQNQRFEDDIASQEMGDEQLGPEEGYEEGHDENLSGLENEGFQEPLSEGRDPQSFPPETGVQTSSKQQQQWKTQMPPRMPPNPQESPKRQFGMPNRVRSGSPTRNPPLIQESLKENVYVQSSERSSSGRDNRGGSREESFRNGLEMQNQGVQGKSQTSEDDFGDFSEEDF